MNATESTPAVKTERKARRKSARSVCMIEGPRPESGDYFALRIVEGKNADVYVCCPVPADFGEGYSVEKLDAANDYATVEQYDVNLAGQESTCTCKGNTYCGHCRHVESLQALDRAGQLPRRPVRQKHASCPRCNDASEGGVLCPACWSEAEYCAAYDAACEMGHGPDDAA